MNDTTLDQHHRLIPAGQGNSAEIGSPACAAVVVAASVVATLAAVVTHMLGIPRRGDGAIILPAATLLAAPEDRELLRRYIRLVSNHLQIIYSEYHSIRQPVGTSNFIMPGTSPIANQLEQNELRLILPEECVVEDRAEAQGKLDEFSALLRQRGFVAYKDSHILLNPETHFAVAMVYDENSKKICLHIRDTASDGFWEKGSWVNWVADLRQGLGLMPDVYVDGDMFVRGCAEIFGPENLQITGYSMGGGIGIFAGARNFVPAVVFNPAFLSPYLMQLFPDGGHDFAKENIQVLSVANDVLSMRLDNPETGGVFPTELFEGARVYLTDPASEATGPFAAFRNSAHGHCLSALLFGLIHVAMQDPELCEYAWQTLQELPGEAQAAFIQQNAPLLTQFFQTGMLAILAGRGQLMPAAQLV
jgi:hypothetical protein